MIVATSKVAYASAEALDVIANTLVIGETKDIFVPKRWFRKTTIDDVADALTKVRTTGKTILASYEHGIQLREINRITGASRTPSASKEIIIALDNPLNHLLPGKNYGFVAEGIAKTLLAPGSQSTSDWYGANFKRIINDPYHRKLTEALNRKDAKAAELLIRSYLDEDYSFADRVIVGVGQGLRRLVDACVAQPAPAIKSSRTASAIIETHGDRERQAKVWSQKYGMSCTALKTIPRIIVKGNADDIEELTGKLPKDTGVHARLAHTRVITLPKPKRLQQTLDARLAHVELINGYAAQRVTQGDDVPVAIMDSGVDYSHKDLKHHFSDELGHNFVRPGDPMDRHGHGTHVAGIVSAVAPKVQLYALKVLDDDGRGSEADILLAYEWCYARKVPIVNCSFGGSYCSDEERQVVEAGKRYGCLIVAAAGNESSGEDGPDVLGYPAAIEGVQSIASVNANKRHSYFSNMGKIELTAMGEDVLSTLPNNGYGVMDGTSMASPSVAGAFALQLATHADYSIDDRLMIAYSRAQKDFAQLPKDEWKRRFGFGIPDCRKWVE